MAFAFVYEYIIYLNYKALKSVFNYPQLKILYTVLLGLGKNAYEYNIKLKAIVKKTSVTIKTAKVVKNFYHQAPNKPF